MNCRAFARARGEAVLWFLKEDSKRELSNERVFARLDVMKPTERTCLLACYVHTREDYAIIASPRLERAV